MSEFALTFWSDAVTATVDDSEIGTYVFAPDAVASESPKPYWHPLRALDGGLVTGYRPWDHRWHKGLQMTWTHLSGQNFWGGPTYVHGEGYVMRDNAGRMRHDSFTRRARPGRRGRLHRGADLDRVHGRGVGRRRAHPPTARRSTPSAASGSWTSRRRSATSAAPTSSSAARPPRAASAPATPACSCGCRVPGRAAGCCRRSARAGRTSSWGARRRGPRSAGSTTTSTAEPRCSRTPARPPGRRPIEWFVRSRAVPGARPVARVPRGVHPRGRRGAAPHATGTCSSTGSGTSDELTALAEELAP